MTLLYATNLVSLSHLEIGYRFFYLGQGGLQKETDAILNSFKTGSGYANALIFSTEF